MQVAKQVLVDDAGKYPDIDALANAFIYLQASNTTSAIRSFLSCLCCFCHTLVDTAEKIVVVHEIDARVSLSFMV